MRQSSRGYLGVMIHPTHGDILKCEADALVNTVNCVGVMGRGIALQFRRAFGDNYEAYRAAVRRSEVEPGRMFVFERLSLEPPRWIINFPTKQHWRSTSRLEDIRSGLDDLVRVVRQQEIRSIAIPPLGCGLGGLDWAVVRPLIVEAFGDLAEVKVFLHEPGEAPAPEAMVNRTRKPPMTKARAVTLGLIGRYLRGLMDPEITMVEIYKLLYFLEFAGESLRLGFERGHHGPYSNKIRHILNGLEGHYINGFGDGGEDPSKPIELRDDAHLKGEAFLKDHVQTLARFEQVGRLIQGFETPYGMELLSSVHWVAVKDGARTPDEAVEKVHAWNERKTTFTPYQIGIAWDRLCAESWMNINEPALSD